VIPVKWQATTERHAWTSARRRNTSTRKPNPRRHANPALTAPVKCQQPTDWLASASQASTRNLTMTPASSVRLQASQMLTQLLVSRQRKLNALTRQNTGRTVHARRVPPANFRDLRRLNAKLRRLQLRFLALFSTNISQKEEQNVPLAQTTK